MSDKLLDTAAVLAKIISNKTPSSRIGRFFRAPLRNTVIGVARNVGISFPLASKLIWGDNFNGVVPEAVTSLIWRHGFYEEATSIFILQNLKHGGRFVDIGAHFGYFTILASRIVGAEGRVVAVEAMPETYKLLKNNIDKNSLDNVESYEMAASSKKQTLIFKDFGIVNSSANTSSVARGVMANKEAFGREVKVNGAPLDGVLNKANSARIDMIKIDAESSEEDVLLGLRETLEKHKPIMLIELGGAAGVEEDLRVQNIFSFMASFNYRGCKFDGEQLEEIKETQNLPYMNVIFTQTH